MYGVIKDPTPRWYCGRLLVAGWETLLLFKAFRRWTGNHISLQHGSNVFLLVLPCISLHRRLYFSGQWVDIALGTECWEYPHLLVPPTKPLPTCHTLVDNIFTPIFPHIYHTLVDNIFNPNFPPIFVTLWLTTFLPPFCLVGTIFPIFVSTFVKGFERVNILGKLEI